MSLRLKDSLALTYNCREGQMKNIFTAPLFLDYFLDSQMEIWLKLAAHSAFSVVVISTTTEK